MKTILHTERRVSFLACSPRSRSTMRGRPCAAAVAVTWLLRAQNADGGWGAHQSVPSSIEETGVALAALARSLDDGDANEVARAIARGTEWLTAATAGDGAASPLGLYFARLWYYEELYPIVFALAGLAAVRRTAMHTEYDTPRH